MAGTDEDAVAAEDDALYVLTAVLLTPAKFPSVLGDDYPEACAALGLPPLADGYGLVLGQDGDGARWTVVIDDVSLVAVAIASWDCGMEYDLSPDERSIVAALPGWPLAVAVAAPGVPAPHDPAPEADDRPPLSPPDTSSWGPAQRRLGADEIALQWTQWREQVDDGPAGDAAASDLAAPDPAASGAASGPAASGAASGPPDVVASGAMTDPAAPGAAPGSAASGASGPTASTPATSSSSAQAAERSGEEAEHDAEVRTRGENEVRTRGENEVSARGENQVSAPGESGETARGESAGQEDSVVRRVLAQARAYTESPPPLGRVRSSFAPGEARTLRADGPGWSLVARTDDMAFILLDEEPGEVIPVQRGPELPGLLEALDKIAVRPL